MSLPPAQQSVIAVSTADHDLLIEIKTMLTGVIQRDEDTEKRVRALEAWKWKAVGVSSFASALLSGGLVTVVFEAVHR